MGCRSIAIQFLQVKSIPTRCTEIRERIHNVVVDAAVVAYLPMKAALFALLFLQRLFQLPGWLAGPSGTGPDFPEAGYNVVRRGITIISIRSTDQ